VTNGKINFSDAWKRQGTLLLLLLLLLGVSYYSTFKSIVSIWLRSGTYEHGFIIAPISLWLIWRIRHQLLAIKPKVNYLGVPLLILLGLVWLLATYIDVLAIMQLAAVSMIPVLVFTLLGWKVTSAMVFPLFFILLCVPLGEELTPILIEFTADFTVAMIKLVDIPVYREGNFLQLPTGNWSVVSACSGIRYLIASVTLGLLYAYLSYKSLFKKCMFVFVAFVVPIIANGLRAFIIVMLGHLSDMKLATGVDHLIYGWVFFGIVIGIMMYVGSFWADEKDTAGVTGYTCYFGNLEGVTVAGKITVMLAAVILIAWPVKAKIEQKIPDFNDLNQISIAAPDGWRGADREIVWKPAYHGFDRVFSNVYKNGAGKEIELYIGYYAEQRQDAELGNYNNVLVSERDNKWRVIETPTNTIKLSSESIQSSKAILSSGSKRLMVNYLYYVDGKILANKYQTKILQAKVKLLGQDNDAAAIFISTTHHENNSTDELIERFAENALPQVKAAIDGLRRN